MKHWVIICFFPLLFSAIAGCDNSIPPSDNEISQTAKEAQVTGKWDATKVTFPDGTVHTPDDSIGRQVYFYPKSDSICLLKSDFFIDTSRNDTFCADTQTIYRQLASFNFYRNREAVILNIDLAVNKSRSSSINWIFEEAENRILLKNDSLSKEDYLKIFTLKDSTLEVKVNPSTDGRVLFMEKR